MKGLYKTYLFRDKDPVIDVVRTIVEDSGHTFAHIERESNVKTATLRNWFGGTTKRPQFATVAAVAAACGEHVKIGRFNVSSKRRKRK